MKELFFVVAVFLILILETKPKERVSMSQPASNETQVQDYYYSAQSAAWWHDLNGKYFAPGLTGKMTISKVNGISYTEKIAHGAKPTCNVTDAVLVASGIEGDGLTVEYTSIVWLGEGGK